MRTLSYCWCCRRWSVHGKNNQINYGKLKQLPTHETYMKFNTHSMWLHRFTAYGNINTHIVCYYYKNHMCTFVYCCLPDNGIISYIRFRETLYTNNACLRAKKRSSLDHTLALPSRECEAAFVVVAIRAVFSWDTSNWYENREKANHLFFSIALFLIAFHFWIGCWS